VSERRRGLINSTLEVERRMPLKAALLGHTVDIFLRQIA
jgi:hypothetical protein